MHNTYLRFLLLQLTKLNWSRQISGPAFSAPVCLVLHFPSVLHFSPACFGPTFFYPGNLVPHFPIVSVGL